MPAPAHVLVQKAAIFRASRCIEIELFNENKTLRSPYILTGLHNALTYGLGKALLSKSRTDLAEILLCPADSGKKR